MRRPLIALVLLGCWLLLPASPRMLSAADDLSAESVPETLLDGRWKELSFRRGDTTSVEMEVDHHTDTLVPVKVVWNFTSRKLKNHGATRSVLAGETNDTPRNHYFGAHRLKMDGASVAAWRLHPTGVSGRIEFQQIPVAGIFHLTNDFLVIAIPDYRFQHRQKTYSVAKPPMRFVLPNGTPPLMAVDADGDSSHLTIYTLKRETPTGE